MGAMRFRTGPKGIAPKGRSYNDQTAPSGAVFLSCRLALRYGNFRERNMIIAYWCILIAALLPYAWVFIAKQSGERYNNHDPRSWQAKQTNPRSMRAHAAHLNGFESFPAFVAGVLMAQLAGVPHATITLLAIVFVIARVLHGVLYIANRHSLRSLVWVIGFGSAIALIVMAALKVG